MTASDNLLFLTPARKPAGPARSDDDREPSDGRR